MTYAQPPALPHKSKTAIGQAVNVPRAIDAVGVTRTNTPVTHVPCAIGAIAVTETKTPAAHFPRGISAVGGTETNKAVTHIPRGATESITAVKKVANIPRASGAVADPWNSTDAESVMALIGTGYPASCDSDCSDFAEALGVRDFW